VKRVFDGEDIVQEKGEIDNWVKGRKHWNRSFQELGKY
jgi:hypothetical protein